MGAADAFFEMRRDCANPTLVLREERRFLRSRQPPAMRRGERRCGRTTPALTACSACPLLTRTHPV